MMAYLQHYSIQKRKKIALFCALGFGILLLIVLIIVYTNPSVKKHTGLSSVITSGYTTILESAQSYFTNN